MKEIPRNQVWIDDWIRLAQEDLLYAKDGMKSEHKPYHTVSFLCQSSGEKYLKAYLISQGWELEKIHDLKQLLDYSRKHDASFSELNPQAEILNEYITAGRYPGDLPFESIGEKQAREAIEAAEKIERFVLQRMAASERNDSEE